MLGEAHLKRVHKEYILYFNRDRPHQGLEQRVPEPPEEESCRVGPIAAQPVLGGLHHTCPMKHGRLFSQHGESRLPLALFVSFLALQCAKGIGWGAGIRTPPT